MNEQSTTSSSLGGIITAILTPVRADLSIDTERLVAHARDLLAKGGSRVSTFGSTGEGVAFSSPEKREAVEALLAAGIRTDQLLPAIMTSSVGTAAQELADLAELGCREVLVLPPFYYGSPSVAGLVSFYEALFERAGRPNVRHVLYNIPAMSGVTITHDLIRALRAGKGAPIAGVKDSTGNIESGLAYVKAFPDLAIFTGDDRRPAQSLCRGSRRPLQRPQGAERSLACRSRGRAHRPDRLDRWPRCPQVRTRFPRE
jgi:4-hydroxy-tetrahydrodipicolinate synthase